MLHEPSSIVEACVVLVIAGSLLIVLGITIAGWDISQRRSELARKGARISPLLLAATFVWMVSTGWIWPAEAAVTAHRWGAHLLVALAWLTVPFAIGVTLQRHIRQRPTLAIVQVVTLLLLLGSTSFASFTGYVGPPGLSLLHLLILPGLIVVSLVVWYSFYGRCKTSGPDTKVSRHTALRTSSSDSSNDAPPSSATPAEVLAIVGFFSLPAIVFLWFGWDPVLSGTAGIVAAGKSFVGLFGHALVLPLIWLIVVVLSWSMYRDLPSVVAIGVPLAFVYLCSIVLSWIGALATSMVG